MRLEETSLKDCFIIHNTVFNDGRGFFFESFNGRNFEQQTGLKVTFVQDNQSRSVRGVLRGLHFQKGDNAQAKLVRVLRGEVLDVVVDLRKSSSTFGQSLAVTLSENSNTQLFVPRGFAHAFVVLSESADFFYKCDNYYNKASEGGIIFNDQQLAIDWKIDETELLVSDKDKELPTLQNLDYFFE